MSDTDPPDEDAITVRPVVFGPFDTSKMPPPPTDDQIENWAITMEAAMLTAEGHSVRIAGWPDRERAGLPQNQGETTPDCLLEIDDDITAVEVKQFWPGETGGRQDAEWSHLQDLVRDEIMVEIEALGCMVLAQVGFRRWPSKKLLPSLANDLVVAFKSVLPELREVGSAFVVRRFPVAAIAEGVPESVRRQFTTLEFRLMPGLSPNVTLLSIDTILPMTPGPEYEKTVSSLLSGAAVRQLRGFDRARIFVAAHPPFFASLLQDALLVRAHEIPANWHAVTAGVIGGIPVRIWEH